MEIGIKKPDTFTDFLLLPFNFIAALVDLVFCIPFLGRLLKWLWNSVITFFHFLIGLVEFGLWKLGYRPEKKFRVGFLILCDEEGKPLVETEKVIPAVKKAQQIYEQAHIQIIPAYPVPKKLPESGVLPEAELWVRTMPTKAAKRILEVDCNFPAFIQDFGLPGYNYQSLILTNFFESGIRRITGYGSPVTVMIVRNIGKFAGCSIGWFSDYVTVKYRHLFTTAHELGHACNLLHREDENNLMHPRSGRQEQIILTNWQIAMIRSSRHVTLF